MVKTKTMFLTFIKFPSLWFRAASTHNEVECPLQPIVLFFQIQNSDPLYWSTKYVLKLYLLPAYNIKKKKLMIPPWG